MSDEPKDKERPAPTAAQLQDALAKAVTMMMTLAAAVVAYDESIAGAAARGGVPLREGGGGVASGAELDRLYDVMVTVARAIARAPRRAAPAGAVPDAPPPRSGT